MSRVAFAGSSSVEPTSPLPAALALELGLSGGEWVALGRRGSRLSQWIDPELPEDLRAIVVMIVANDPRPTASEVREVDAAMRRFAPRVVWLPPPPYPSSSRIAGRDRRMREALAGSGVVWVERAVALEPRHWAPDQIHLTRAGYRAYARQVAPRLWEHLAGSASPRAGRPAPRGVIGHVLTSGGLHLTVTSEDAVWLARACVGEGGGEADACAVASTMLRRWAMLRDGSSRSPFGSLADLVVGRFAGADPYEGEGRAVELRGYSQPVAVQWRGPGARAARRRRVRTMAWADVEPWRRAAVLGVLTGRAALTAWPAVHFAARGLVERRLVELPGWRLVAVPGARNAFVSTARSRRYRDPVVFGADGRRAPSRRPVPRAPLSPPSPPNRAGAGPAALLVGVATLGVALVRGLG